VVQTKDSKQLVLLIAPPPLDLDDEDKPLPKGVIDSYELAEKQYTAAYLYALNKCHEQASKNISDTVNKALYRERFRDATSVYETLDDDKKARWEEKC